MSPGLSRATYILSAETDTPLAGATLKQMAGGANGRRQKASARPLFGQPGIAYRTFNLSQKARAAPAWLRPLSRAQLRAPARAP
ncbi:hypothetical protein FIU93_01865 [Labrenzia sp. THAF35]|nr:hypothetical protein FIU93_01865 [Labrenzia sp. THAF35]